MSPPDGLSTPHLRPKARFSNVTLLVKVAAAFGVLALAGVFTIVFSHCSSGLRLPKPVYAGAAEAVKIREQLPAILRREISDASIAGLQPYDYSAPDVSEASGSVASGAAAARATGEHESNYPVSTQTSLSATIHNITQTSTTTMTTTIVVTPHGQTTHSCTAETEEEAKTETAFVTVTVVPEKSQPGPSAYGSVSSDATVTGSPTTVTDIQTVVSYTSAAPDVTVSGSPATVTSVQTDTQFTSGAPDATVSGEPVTVTSVVTNTAGEPMTTLTFTSFNTVRVTVTHTRSRSSVSEDSSVLGLPYTSVAPANNSSSSSAVVTYTETETVTVTDGNPVTSTTTIELPAYGSTSEEPSTAIYGTGSPIKPTSSPTHAQPPVVSAGTVVVRASHLAAYLISAAAVLHLF